MKRLHVLQVIDPEKSIDHGEWIEKLGCYVCWVFSAADAINILRDKEHLDAVVIDGFSTEEAEMIALEIRMAFEDIYIGIMNEAIKHRVHNAYADEAIPQTFIQLKEALIHRFHEAM